MKEPVKVLVIDDSRDDIYLTKDALRKLAPKIKIISRNESVGVIQYLSKFDNRELPQLIILDLKMPKIDGFEVLRDLKNKEKLRGIPTIVFTSSEFPQDKKHVAELGGDDYLVKPVDYYKFREKIKEIYERWIQEKAIYTR